jgi:transcriptional regulator with XRE-family HTH domain
MLNTELTPAPASIATSVDQHVGRRIRGKRRALGLSEENLATALGVEANQIAAYERAAERVPSDHLIRLSQVFGVPLSYFFPTTPFAAL